MTSPPMTTETASAALSCQRAQFRLPRDVHWLNCAYLSPLARSVEETGVHAIGRKAVPTEIGPEDFFRDSTRLRQRFARLIHAPDAERVAILPSVSYGVATCARNVDLGSGRNVVVMHEQFPGNVYSWRSLCQRHGAELRVVRPAATGPRGPEWTARALDAIDANTAVVAMGTVHWTDGTRFDLDAIGARARDVGAAFILDGTQSIGALPFDVERIRPDAVIVAGYKWLMGPYSTGLAWYGPRFDGGQPLEETWIARKGSENFSGLVDYVDDYAPGAVRYDVGERSNFILVPMLSAALDLVLEWTPERIQDYCASLTRELLEVAEERGWAVEDRAWRGEHLFGLRAPAGVDLDGVTSTLSRAGVYVSRRGSALRISPHVYNDAEDVAALTQVLRES